MTKKITIDYSFEGFSAIEQDLAAQMLARRCGSYTRKIARDYHCQVEARFVTARP